jgi:hypothetical protein
VVTRVVACRCVIVDEEMHTSLALHPSPDAAVEACTAMPCPTPVSTPLLVSPDWMRRHTCHMRKATESRAVSIGAARPGLEPLLGHG